MDRFHFFFAYAKYRLNLDFSILFEHLTIVWNSYFQFSNVSQSVIFGFVRDVTSHSSSEDFLLFSVNSLIFCSQSWKNYNWPKSDCWSCASCVCCHQKKCLPKHLFLHLKCNLKTMCDFHLSNRITSKHTLIPMNQFPFLPIARNKIQVATTFRPVV